MKCLTTKQIEHFNGDGYLVIEDFLSPEEVARVKADIARVSEEVSSAEADFRGFNFERADGASYTESQNVRKGVLRKIQGAVFHVPTLNDVFVGDKMLNCMEDLMGAHEDYEGVFYHSSKVMFKPPGGIAKPWHQDAAYWREYAANQITVWIAIDDATKENGCVWAIPGSHKAGLIPHIKTELEVEESRIDLTKAIPVPVPAGGLLIFHSLVLHMSQKNESDKTRWAIICDYDCLPNPSVDVFDDIERPKEMDERNVWPLRVVELA